MTLFDDVMRKFIVFLTYPVLRPSKVCGPLIISIGNNGIRRKIAKELKVEYGKAFHPSAIISEETEIREGSVVMQGQLCSRMLVLAAIVLSIPVLRWIMNV